jgi:lipopolysaccharide/colanic/teichoic acid biosynthesis glycosyltransferase
VSAGRSSIAPASLDGAVELFVPDLPSGRLTWWRSGKWLFDILVTLALSPLALPILAVAAAAILLMMGPPVFFRQSRVGLGGRPFMILKLRTMRPREGGDQIATAIGDTRVTPLGRWLRRSHLDELPQLWNVLVGEMSLVGPRPEQPALAEAYAREAPAFAYRQLMRPGITGWAQVRAGYAADLAETEVKLAHDLFYLKNCSFALDVEICARTVWALLSGEGAR